MNLDCYGEKLADEKFWGSHVNYALSTIQSYSNVKVIIQSGFPGSYPTFLCSPEQDDGKKVVIKMFVEDLYDGDRIFNIERNALEFIQTLDIINIPKVIGSGMMKIDEKQVYFLCMEFMKGLCVREVVNTISDDAAWENISSQLGRIVQKLHQTSPLSIDKEGHVDFKLFMTQRRRTVMEFHKKWKILPEKMISEITSYFGKYDMTWTSFCQEENYAILHGDLTEDHVFIEKRIRKKEEEEEEGEKSEDGRLYDVSGIIDFGDVRIGHPIYEMVPAFFGVFYGRKKFFRPFLEAYGWNERYNGKYEFDIRIGTKDFRYYFFCFTLLFEFNVLLRHKEEIQRFERLSDLQEYFFDL